MEAARSPWPALGVLLIRDGLITPDELDEVLAAQDGEERFSSKRLGELLVERGSVTPAQVARLVAEQHEFPFVDLDEPDATVPTAAGHLTEDLAREHSALPIRRFPDGSVLVVVADPTVPGLYDEIHRDAGVPVRFAVGAPESIEAAIDAASADGRFREPETATDSLPVFLPGGFALPPLTSDDDADLAAAWPVLGSLLMRDGLITQEELEGALAQQRLSSTRRLGEILVQRGALNERQLAQALAEQHELPYVDLAGREIDRIAAARLPLRLAREHCALPVEVFADGSLLVAVADPTSTFQSTALRAALGVPFMLGVAAPDEIEAAIDALDDEVPAAPETVGGWTLTVEAEADPETTDEVEVEIDVTELEAELAAEPELDVPALVLAAPATDEFDYDSVHEEPPVHDDEPAATEPAGAWTLPTVVDVEPEPELDAEADVEAVPEVAWAPVFELDVEQDEDPEPEAVAEDEPEAVVEAESEPVAEADPEPEPAPELELVEEAEAEPETPVEPEPEPGAEADPDPEPAPEPDVAEETEPEAFVGSESEPDPDADPEPEPTAAPELTPVEGGSSTSDPALTTEIEAALALGASAVHVVTQPDGLVVRARLDGELFEVATVSSDDPTSAISALADVARLGRARFTVDGRTVELRAAVLPTVLGEHVTFRVVDEDAPARTLEDLYASTEAIDAVRGALARKDGLVVVCSATDAERSAALYAALHEAVAPGRSVVSIEDPVEQLVPGVDQVEVDPRSSVTYSTGLHTAFRSDADVAAVGELIDAETVRLATRGAGSRCVVVATLAARSTAEGVRRLLDLGAEPTTLASTLACMVAVHPVRTPCVECRTSSYATLEELTVLGRPPEESGRRLVARAPGCDVCGGDGYVGSTRLDEVLPLTAEVRRAVAMGAHAGELERAAAEAGMRTLVDAAVDACLEGLTTADQVARLRGTARNGATPHE